jgi:hypothetical protein
LLLLAGCSAKEAVESTSTTTAADSAASGAGTTEASPTASATTGASVEATPGPGAAVADAKEIPPGQSYPEGSYTAYTFREVWRQALVAARQWRGGAFLIGATGTYVDERGVPTMWQMRFVSSIPADQILTIDIDPWGQVSAKQVTNTAKVTDQIQPGDQRAPWGIMDSDAAVKVGRQVMATGHDLNLSNNPSLQLSFGRDGSGPYWTYSVDGPSGSRVSAQVDALTAKGKLL